MLAVRDARPEDAPALARLFSEPSVQRQTYRTTERAEADARRFTTPEDGTRRVVAVSPDGEAVGFLALVRHGHAPARHAAEIAVMVAERWRGRGVGRALLVEALRTAFGEWGLARVELEVVADNAPAIGLYESLGFRREGVRRASYGRDGALLDSLLMGMLREEWRP